MPVNDFEGKVQQKIEELKLTPSAEVWQHVEARIRKERKRRILFLLLSFFSLLFFAGLFWMNVNRNNKELNSSIKKIENDSSKINSETDSLQKVKSENVGLGIISEKNINAILKTPSVFNKTKAHSFLRLHSNYKLTQQNAEMGDDDVINNSALIRKSKAKISIVGEGASDTTNEMKDTIQQNSISFNKNLNAIEIKKSNQDTNMLASTKNVKDTSKIKINNPLVNDKKTNLSKWNFAVSVGLGMSATANNFLGNTSSNNTVYVTSASGPPITSGIGQNFQPTIKISYAFKVGFSSMYHLSKKLTVSAGLTYKLYSTEIMTGTKLDSAASVAFSTGTSNSYHNYYHFIDMPIELQYRIGNNKQYPVFVFGGVSLSQLIYTNALQYNYTQKIFYRENSLFNKTTVGLTGGLLIDLFKKQKLPLQMGPDLYYGLSKMAGAGIYSDKHYSFVGIRFQKIIGKK